MLCRWSTTGGPDNVQRLLSKVAPTLIKPARSVSRGLFSAPSCCSAGDRSWPIAAPRPRYAVGVRARILRGMEWLGVRMDPDGNHRNGPRLHAGTSKVAVWVVRAEEERMIAEDALGLFEDAP